MHYNAFGKTDIGKVYKNNEDVFFTTPTEGVFMIADGMGGRNAGEVASQMTLDILRNSLAKIFDGNSVERALREILLEANEKVREKAASGSEFQGMGCTCVLLVLTDESFFIAHVGDSRLYLFRKGDLQLVTRDHSYVEELFIRGLITEEEKIDHPYRNQITRYIGASKKLEIDITSGPISSNDVFMLCSDGLSEELSMDKMKEIFAKNLEPQETVEMLISEALNSGGRDNVTTVVAKVVAKKTSFFKKILGW